MKLHENCLSCIVKQAVSVAKMTGAEDREALYRKVFAHLSQVDFSLTAPELCGEIFALVKAHIGVDDPYLATRKRCNALMMSLLPGLRAQLAASEDPFRLAVKYAILGNIIDFSAPGVLSEEGILATFATGGSRDLVRDDVPQLREACLRAQKLLYLGDNCGEIAADRLLLEELHRLNPSLEITVNAP